MVIITVELRDFHFDQCITNKSWQVTDQQDLQNSCDHFTYDL